MVANLKELRGYIVIQVYYLHISTQSSYIYRKLTYFLNQTLTIHKKSFFNKSIHDHKTIMSTLSRFQMRADDKTQLLNLRRLIFYE